jgi:hypothetical protein
VLALQRCGGGSRDTAIARDAAPDRDGPPATLPSSADAAAPPAPLDAPAPPPLADAAPAPPHLPDAALRLSPPPRFPDAAPPDASAPSPPPPPDAATPARILRKVRINARPWATFTVDGKPTVHETISTLELSPGPHRLHFSNPQLGVERDVTIDVPPDRDLDHVEDLRR